MCYNNSIWYLFIANEFIYFIVTIYLIFYKSKDTKVYIPVQTDTASQELKCNIMVMTIDLLNKLFGF